MKSHDLTAETHALISALQDSQYENDLLNRIASESSTFAALVLDSLKSMEEFGDDHVATWLGSFTDGRPKTQVQLVVTQNHEFTIDED
ncbi:hypothetical protein [uncultured Rheinheimera sp.]|uniref:hypothetical protein n=1 Tax=uncultured Rheinheimera sp. TaxID=400532 RepID=UPI002599D51B|nr:hypothetical protein [uncultured Rheinheimera sp.]